MSGALFISRRIGFGSSVGRPIFLVGNHLPLSADTQNLPERKKTIRRKRSFLKSRLCIRNVGQSPFFHFILHFIYKTLM